ncbi:MAG: Smr/MutS family protein [Clostridiales Family XIII bacterium]|jgi:DNA mismatch repair protein MutS2|nr:Smr/MutS family protein [Clostridiales Family XIII bacterium]
MAERVREYAILEYYKVLGMLADRTASRLASALASELVPADSAHEIRKRQTETTEAVSVCLRKGTPPFANIADIRENAAYAEKGGGLSMKQLLEVGRALDAAKRVRAHLTSDMPADAYGIRARGAALAVLRPLEDRIAVSIISETEMSDGAGSRLRGLRRAIEAQNEKIRNALGKYITSSAYGDVLMDRLVTMRDGRFVIPVKQEQAGKVPGIVHDRSRGGSTVFIEPQAVVDMNNKLRELQLEEAAEIERILAEISSEVGASSGDLRENQRLLTELDFAFAKANLSLDMKAVPPEVSADGLLDIAEGRNPLIGAASVVPVSIRFGGTAPGARRILIITGPNTGGKTVTLKTAGLFLLMAQAGLHVPAARASVPIAGRVFADIGDEQSIEQSLSTFSSHMKNIVEIIREADAGSVVLLDELGAGTDPTEGAALGISILEELRRRGCLVMATTHYTELKKYAIAAEGVQNASMEFDVATLSPTYRLLMGNPGRSNAFEISRKLGLGVSLIERARGYLDAETIAFDDVMAEIEADHIAAARGRAEAERLMDEAAAARQDAEEKIKAALGKREEIIDKAKEKARETIEDAAEYAEVVRAELKEIIKDARTRGVSDGGGNTANAGDLLRRVDEERKTLRELDGGYRGSAQGESRKAGAVFGKKARGGEKGASGIGPRGQTAGGAALEIGDEVAIAGTELTGEVLTLPDERGKLTVIAGAVKMTLSADAVAGTGRRAVKKAGRGESRYAKIVLSKMDGISASLDLHGKNLDEAEMLVDKYLDDAVLARMHEVSINHGRGEGILRNGVRRLLKGHKHVAKFRSGDFDEGGDGVTIVTLSNK